MGVYALLIELFAFFKLMQKVIEIKWYVIKNNAFPGASWLLRGRVDIDDQVEDRSRLIYKWCAAFFGWIAVLIAMAGAVDFSYFNRGEFLNGTIGLFLFFIFRAWPYIRFIANNIKNGMDGS